MNSLWTAKYVEDGEIKTLEKFEHFTLESAWECMLSLFKRGEILLSVAPHKEPSPVLPKGQLKLPLIHFPFQEYLGGFKRISKAVGKKIAAVTWTQLTLKLHLRKLYKIPKIGFVWTRPDGKQFTCKTMKKLVARIMDFDGHLLKGVLRMA